MKQIEYKKFTINHVYDCSKGYEKLDYYNIWTPNGLDMVAEEFPNIKSVKIWINQHLKEGK